MFFCSLGFPSYLTKFSFPTMLLQLLMTWIAVLKVDDLGRRPLLIGGVAGIVCILSCFSFHRKIFPLSPLLSNVKDVPENYNGLFHSPFYVFRLSLYSSSLLITNFSEDSILLLLRLCSSMWVAIRWLICLPQTAIPGFFIFCCSTQKFNWNNLSCQ